MDYSPCKGYFLSIRKGRYLADVCRFIQLQLTAGKTAGGRIS